MKDRNAHLIALSWLAAATWAGVIWSLGSDWGASHTTSKLLGPLIEWLLPGITPPEKWKLMHFIRKSAHVAEYAVLALLVLRAARLSWQRSVALATSFSVGVVTVMAIADEVRQSQSAVRVGSAWDVTLDIFGGLLAIALALATERVYRRRMDPTEAR